VSDPLRFDHDRMVGESFREYAARMAGRARAAERDAEHARLELAELRAELTELRNGLTERPAQ
jgi:hypothetical protein